MTTKRKRKRFHGVWGMIKIDARAGWAEISMLIGEIIRIWVMRAGIQNTDLGKYWLRLEQWALNRWSKCPKTELTSWVVRIKDPLEQF